MKEYTTPFGRKIYVFENAIPKDICQSLILQVPMNSLAKYTPNKKLADHLNLIYNTYCNPPPINFAACTDKVTYAASKNTIPYHTDPHDKHSQQWKVLFYLNTVENGGTIFREGGQDISVDNSEGTVVIFDTSIPHLGNPNQSQTIVKYTIGFFPLTTENQLYFASHKANIETMWLKNTYKLNA